MRYKISLTIAFAAVAILVLIATASAAPESNEAALLAQKEMRKS
jgi:hypothetical protein